MDVEDENMLVVLQPYHEQIVVFHTLYTTLTADRREPEVKVVVTFAASHI
jgi:hypothetical protein